MPRVKLAVGSLAMVVVIGFGLLVLLRTLDRILWLVLLVVLSLILAAAIMPIVQVIHGPRLPPGGWQVPKALAVVAIYICGAVLIGILGYVVGGLLVAELLSLPNVFASRAGGAIRNLDGIVQSLGIPPPLVPSANQLSAQLHSVVGNVLLTLRSFVGSLVQFIIRLFIMLTLTLFLIIESSQILDFWVGLFPCGQHQRVRELTVRIGDRMASWVLGQLAVTTVVGIIAGIAAAVLGLPFPALIGVVTGLLELAPMLGPTLMIFPVVLLGLLQSPVQAVVAGLVFFGIAELDANVLSPLITGRAVHLSPTIIIIAIPIGATLFGVIGALIAVPVAAGLKVVADEVILPWLHAREQRATTGSTHGQRAA